MAVWDGNRDWLVPSSLLTVTSAALALAFLPLGADIWPALGILFPWMVVGVLLATCCALVSLVARGETRPIARIWRALRQDRAWLAVVLGGLLLAGFNMTTFMWTKPLLNINVPFWADPLLAQLDWSLFFGHDPWRLLTRLNTHPLAIFYHRGWFAMMLLALIVTLASPASERRSAVLITYFLLWSVVGPVIHILMPAAGPIFYEQLGYGSRFAGLKQVSDTGEVADYLWSAFAERRFEAGGGISAMPSLHIATTAWMMIAIRSFAPRLTFSFGIAAALIILLSIALGWHYAMDGVVGTAAAAGCYKLLLFALRRRSSSESQQRPSAVGTPPHLASPG